MSFAGKESEFGRRARARVDRASWRSSSSASGAAPEKIAALEAAGVRVSRSPSGIGVAMEESLREAGLLEICQV